jgi:hypothetical protein
MTWRPTVTRLIEQRCARKKTDRPVRFERTEQTRQAIDEYLRQTCRKPGEFLFAGRCGDGHGLTTRQYAPCRPVDRQHRPRSAQVRHALPAPNQGDADLSANGQFESTVRYLGIEIDDAI